MKKFVRSATINEEEKILEKNVESTGRHSRASEKDRATSQGNSAFILLVSSKVEKGRRKKKSQT